MNENDSFFVVTQTSEKEPVLFVLFFNPYYSYYFLSELALPWDEFTVFIFI